MDMKAVGLRIKKAREAKKLTQEDLAALVELSPTHISVIERGLKTVKLDKFVAIANALDVSADSLLVDVAIHSVERASPASWPRPSRSCRPRSSAGASEPSRHIFRIKKISFSIFQPEALF